MIASRTCVLTIEQVVRELGPELLGVPATRYAPWAVHTLIAMGKLRALTIHEPSGKATCVIPRAWLMQWQRER